MKCHFEINLDEKSEGSLYVDVFYFVDVIKVFKDNIFVFRFL